ncbi:argonaute-like protein [Winogradskyella pacifica]|uniref:Protein argonaute n=1 Tax=Winogradskyella pacifica TaxID=664642 RepID=A0A3D9N3R8_9FLAO|nr:Piwi domain-containing protein [Winogradskyella pacifica]REE25720.1 argonaute-like protein [Winogradskyella pacifica]
MSGLFLNFYQVEINFKEISTKALNYSDYQSKEDFINLRDSNRNCTFYRENDKILVWSAEELISEFEQLPDYKINLDDNPKVLSRIIENGIVDLLKETGSYRIFKNKYSNTWEIISSKDVLKNSIKGLEINRVVHFSPYFCYKEEKLLLGFTLSSSLKNRFTWTKQEFEKNGIDTTGLKGKEDIIFANRQSIKRFLESTGTTENYESAKIRENQNSTSFQIINKFYNWLEKSKSKIVLPFELNILSISKRYLPFENDIIKSEIIHKPQRYFYSNRKNTQGLRLYDQMVKTYMPYSLEQYQNKKIKLGIICPSEYQGETEVFAKKIESKLKEVFHFNNLSSYFLKTADSDLKSYEHAIYDKELLECDLVYVIVNQLQEKLPNNLSPYYKCKAKLIGNGIPTQDVQIETIRQNLVAFTMTNIALNSYAKLGGTAWTIEKEDKLKDELVIGIGSTISKDGQFVLGIAQIFHNDGRYMTGNCSPLSSFDNYAENLENHLYETLKPLVEEMKNSGTFRLIFHLFKSASERYEIKAINNLKERLSDYNFEFALVHLAYGHNFRLYNNDGRNDIMAGSYIQLSKHSAILHFVKNSDLPLKIDIDKRSTFTSMFYIAKQVYWFSHLSHRSYMPSKRTVTIMYPSLMAKMTEELKKVDNWDYDRLKFVEDKLWFI